MTGVQTCALPILSLIRTELEKSVYDDYDRLVQLCDSIAGAEGVLDKIGRASCRERVSERV